MYFTKKTSLFIKKLLQKLVLKLEEPTFTDIIFYTYKTLVKL